MAGHRRGGAETARRLMVAGVATAPPGQEAREAFRALAGRHFDALVNLHVVEAGGRLLGVVPLAALAAAAPGMRLAQIMLPAEPLQAEERVHPGHHRASAAPPVVDAEGRLLGCIPPQAMLATGRRAHRRATSRMAGILHREENGHPDADGPRLWRGVAARLPWLLAGLAGSAVLAMLVAGFEATLATHVAVAFFGPALVFLADAIGTQTEVLVIRALASGPRRFARLAATELATGTLIGVVLAALALPLIGLVLGDWALGAAVSVALVAAAAAATACGLVFPWSMLRLGVDPAFGSGPIATVFQDGLTLLIYFAVVALLLPA